MTKLKKFKKEKNNKKNFIKIIGVFMVLGILLIGTSYAVYQREDEKTFIDARVADFRVYLFYVDHYATSDSITLRYDYYSLEELNPTVTCSFGTNYGNYNMTATTTSSNECTKNNLEGGTEYFYKVCVKNKLNQEECREDSIWVEFIPPTLSNFEATSTETQIVLNYSASGTRPEVTCKFTLNEGDWWNSFYGDFIDNSTCRKNNLMKGHTYYYSVCVRNEAGNECKEGNIKTKGSISDVQLGDYIRMTPTSTSYTISKSSTGYISDQTINPSELNLWRVIRKNADGTVDVVSQNASSGIHFRGKNGYLNYIVNLQNIAYEYDKEDYVFGIRPMGYGNQPEGCSEVEFCETDTSYLTDVNLVKNAIGTLLSGNRNDYFIASRYVRNIGSSNPSYEGLIVSGDSLESQKFCLGSCSSSSYSYVTAGIRPILTLGSNLIFQSGDGKSEGNAYVFR